MATLLDIAPLVESIEIRGAKLEVRGVSAQGVVYLLNRFPILRQVITGKTPEGMTLESFMVLAPDAINAVIACGLGYVGQDVDVQDKAEKAASSLGLDEQLLVMQKIMEVTLPRGFGPFADLIQSLASRAEGLGKEVATKLGVPLSG